MLPHLLRMGNEALEHQHLHSLEAMDIVSIWAWKESRYLVTCRLSADAGAPDLGLKQPRGHPKTSLNKALPALFLAGCRAHVLKVGTSRGSFVTLKSNIGTQGQISATILCTLKL